MSAPLRIATRGSALALWQARHVAALVSAQAGSPTVELVPVQTTGDVQSEVPLWKVGGRAFFTREIDRALIEGAADIAVHSLKDLPTQIESGLNLVATLARADPRDVLVSRGGVPLAQLAPRARIGTSSLRRRAFLGRLRPDAVLVELRGNVPTRIERLQHGDYEAIVLAAAGVERLGLQRHVTEYLDPDSFPPAVAQGVIGVCARAGDWASSRWLTALDDLDARLTSSAERALLQRLEGGCQVPLGALATLKQGTLTLMARVCAPDGSRELSARADQPAGAQDDSMALGRRVADELLTRGAAELIAQTRSAQGVEEP